MSTGGEFNKVKINEFAPGNNEFVATEDIAEGELIGYIPSEMFLTFEDAQRLSSNTQVLRESNLLEQITSS